MGRFVIVGLAMLLFGFGGAIQAGEPVKVQVSSPVSWQVYHSGLDKAKRSKRVAMIQFFATWCGYCRKMDKEVFSQYRVRKAMDKYLVPIRVTENSQRRVKHENKWVDESSLLSSFQVSGFPTLIFIDAKGETLGQIPGFIDAEEMEGIIFFVGTGAHARMSYEEFASRELPGLRKGRRD